MKGALKRAYQENIHMLSSGPIIYCMYPMLKLFLGPKVSLRKETLYAQYRALIEYPNSLTINEIALGYKMKIKHEFIFQKRKNHAHTQI